MSAYSPATIAQTTPTGAAMAQFVSQHYGQLGEVQHGELLRRSFNQVYGLHFGNGRQAVARLVCHRP